MKNKLISVSFISYSAIYLLIILLGLEDITWYMKPFLIPFLLYLVYTFENFPTKNILLTALLFSWIAALIFLFTYKGKIYFTFGLIAFLFSHVIYIVLFNKQLKIKEFKFNSIFIAGIVAILIYLFILINLLLPGLDTLKIPVILYAIVISSMLLFAFKGSLQWQNPANMYVLLGAFIFVCSDSILAINKFYTELPYASFWIMSTYLVAQFLIVTGILRLNKQKTASPFNENAV
ncbi:lysoplasmalogenase [uncultured Flavobacterium sp.]|uniref:lysoplasmalogenase n=1 Tax=uncultured Flavobacterium sp. TaxID=165435 RepID=UPI0030CA1E70